LAGNPACCPRRAAEAGGSMVPAEAARGRQQSQKTRQEAVPGAARQAGRQNKKPSKTAAASNPLSSSNPVAGGTVSSGESVKRFARQQAAAERYERTCAMRQAGGSKAGGSRRCRRCRGACPTHTRQQSRHKR